MHNCEKKIFDDRHHMLALVSGSRSIQYVYYDSDLNELWHTTVPGNDDQALDYFAVIQEFSPRFKPVYVERNGRILPYMYDGETVWISMPDDKLLLTRYKEVETVTEKPFQVAPISSSEEWDFL